MRAWTLILLAACDDSLYVSDHPYGADWDGTQELLLRHCADCHPNNSNALPEDDIRFGRLGFPDAVQLDACEKLGTLVVPGDLTESLLWRVVSGQRRDGDPPLMPSGRTRLSEDQLLALEGWILSGADADCPP